MVMDRKLRKNVEPIPVTEMTTSISEHKKNNMQPIPIEQKYMILILEEMKAMHETIKRLKQI